MSSTGIVPARDTPPEMQGNGPFEASLMAEPSEAQQSLLPSLRLLWENRRFLLRAGVDSSLASVPIAMLISVRYQSVTRLMPPDGQSGSLGMLAAMAGRAGAGGLGGLAGDALGVKSHELLTEQYELAKVEEAKESRQ